MGRKALALIVATDVRSIRWLTSEEGSSCLVALNLDGRWLPSESDAEMCVSDLSLLALPRDLVLEGIISGQRPPPMYMDFEHQTDSLSSI